MPALSFFSGSAPSSSVRQTAPADTCSRRRRCSTTSIGGWRNSAPARGLSGPYGSAISAPGNLRASQIGSQANAWGGNNYGGYVNPDYDRLYETFANDLDPARRQETLFQIVKLIDEQLPVLPIFYVPQVYAFRTGLTGPGSTAYLQAASTWNIGTWDLN